MQYGDEKVDKKCGSHLKSKIMKKLSQMGSAHEEEVHIPHCVATVMISSKQHQPFNLGENTGKKFPDNGKVSKSEVQQNLQLEMNSKDGGNDKVEHSLPVTSGIDRRPWPSRKDSEAEEMVKFMSSIPSYLQREEKGYNIQEKVLNVGVLDWSRLQKWTDHEKQLVANKMNNDSPSSSNLSTFGSSPFSSRSSAAGPPTHERKQSSTFSITSNLTNSAEKDQRKGRRKDSSKNIQDAADIGSLPSVSKGSENFALLRSNLEGTKLDNRLDELEKLQIRIDQGSSCRSHLNQDGDKPKNRRKHLEEIIARSILSFDAALLDQRKMNSSRILMSGNSSLPSRSSTTAPSSNAHREEAHEACIPPNCSRNSTNHSIVEAKKNAYNFEKGRELLLPIVLPRVDLKGISGSPLKSIADNPNEAVSRSTSTSRGGRSPMRLFFDQPRKSTSSSVGSISDNPDINVAAGARNIKRGRRSSPLRQMLESPPRKSSSLSVHSSDQQPQAESRGVVADPTHPASTRQALLKLCWKNGLPLLMFSSSDDSILVATMHKRGNSDMNICDCVYEIHTAMAVEVKKKNGAWLSQGTKNKKPEFSCKFVAELIVSSSERVSFDLTHRSFIRELVLLGDELVPAASSNQNQNHNHVDATNSSNNSTELAAIVVESSHHKLGSPSCDNPCAPRIVAILPSGVHGISNTREPSKLIEKWESGGSCDCGGWDEGCALTILTNNSKQMSINLFKSAVQDCGAIIDHGTRGFDLFTEGDARKGKSSFSMVSFKEDDMFTVEFKVSIPLLQAFAISIAMLHDRNHLNSVDNYEDISFDSYPVISS